MEGRTRREDTAAFLHVDNRAQGGRRIAFAFKKGVDIVPGNITRVTVACISISIDRSEIESQEEEEEKRREMTMDEGGRVRRAGGKLKPETIIITSKQRNVTINKLYF